MHNALAQTCPMMIKAKWLFYWRYKYDMFHLSPSFRLFTRLFSIKFPFGECVIHRFRFIFFLTQGYPGSFTAKVYLS